MSIKLVHFTDSIYASAHICRGIVALLDLSFATVAEVVCLRADNTQSRLLFHTTGQCSATAQT